MALPISLTGVWLGDVLVLLATLLYLIYKFLTNTSDYFKIRGVPFLKAAFLMGNRDLFSKSSMDFSQSLYESFPGERFFGYFQARVPTLLVKDPELLQLMKVKDFVHFQDQGFHFTGSDLLSANLINMKGHTWRALRNKLTPTLTSGKLKLMFGQLDGSGDHLLDSIENTFSNGPIHAKNLTFDFVLEVIASCAFGLDFSKDNPQTAEFVSRSHSAYVTGPKKVFIDLTRLFAPGLLSWLGVSNHPPGTKEYFLNLVKTNKEYRKKNGVERKDYFQQLLDLQDAEEKGEAVAMSSVADTNEDDDVINQLKHFPKSPYFKDSKLLTDECITSQAFGFLWGGSEMVSETLSYALYHLAKDSAVQATAREEVVGCLARHEGWSYQAVREMVYLDQVLQETLRLYPNMPLHFRVCTMAYRIPRSEVVVEKGTIVAIPVRGLHMDPKFYPDPGRFDPDRFKGNNHKPSSVYMPFGDGPRICIAMRFAILEMKVCLAKILSRYSVQVDTKTEEPFRFDPSSFPPKPLGAGVWLRFQKL